jgi:hypothetical protein
MEDLLTALVAGIEVIFLGSETLLEFLSNTEFLGATLYAWFLGYLVLDTILSLFISVRYDELDNEIMVDEPETPTQFYDPELIVESGFGEVDLGEIDTAIDIERQELVKEGKRITPEVEKRIARRVKRIYGVKDELD